MSKERLEELAYNVGISHTGEYVRMKADDYVFLYEYALEQAERVQELEDVTLKLKQYRDVYSDYLKEEAMKEHSWKQNKRYREALEFIGNHANESELMDNTMYTELVKEIIEKALEESE